MVKTYYVGTSSCFSTSDLEHHGILGMKWGVRRTPEELGHRTAEKYRSKQLKKVQKQIDKADRIIKKGNDNQESYKAQYRKNQALQSKDILLNKIKNINNKSTDELLKERYDEIERNKKTAIQVGKQAAKMALGAAAGIAVGNIVGMGMTAAKFGADLVFNGGRIVTDFGVNKDGLTSFIVGGNKGSVSYMGHVGTVQAAESGGSFVSWDDGSVTPFVDGHGWSNLRGTSNSFARNIN